MTELTESTTTRRPQTAASPAPAQAAPAHEQTLVTEQQVLFSTAAVAVPAKTRRWTIGSVAGAVYAWFAEAAKPPRPPQYSKRYDFLENARMAREMDRL
jgi:hypothetical protein